MRDSQKGLVPMPSLHPPPKDYSLPISFTHSHSYLQTLLTNPTSQCLSNPRPQPYIPIPVTPPHPTATLTFYSLKAIYPHTYNKTCIHTFRKCRDPAQTSTKVWEGPGPVCELSLSSRDLCKGHARVR